MISRLLSLSRAASLGFAVSAAPVLASPIGPEPQALRPSSRTAEAITGPIILSDSRIVFGNGEMLHLSLVDRTNEGTWDITGATVTVQLFDVSGEIGSLVNGNTICGGGSPRFLTAHVTEVFGSQSLTLAFYEGSTRPTGISSPALCGTYGYEYETLITPGRSAMDAPDEPRSPSDGNPGKWIVRSETNPIDDTRTVIVRLSADSGQSRWGKPVDFYARCRSNRTEVYVVWHDYLGDDSLSVYSDFKYVTVRVGDLPAREERWDVSTSGDATFAPAWAGDLLKEMLGADRLVLRTTPHSESPITAVFDTRGLDMALRDLAATCNWNY
jgi:hypothetical protein